MTTLDELKLAWEAHDRKLDQAIRLNHEVLRIEKLNRVRSPLRRFMAELTLEIGLASAALIVIGQFLARHIAEARYVWPASVLSGWLIFCVAVSIQQVVRAKQIEFDQPVTTIQRQLGDLRLLRVKALRLKLLTGQIVWWLPFRIVALNLLFGVDAYRFLSATFIAVNLAAGVAIIPLSIWLAKRFGARLRRSTFLSKLADEIAGSTLKEAQEHLNKLREFETS